jgi:hypothetical protein
LQESVRTDNPQEFLKQKIKQKVEKKIANRKGDGKSVPKETGLDEASQDEIALLLATELEAEKGI